MVSIEKAYKLYKIKKVFLKNVSDDCNKRETAVNSLENSRKDLMELLIEAKKQQINVSHSIPLKDLYNCF